MESYRTNRRLSFLIPCRLDWPPKTNKIRAEIRKVKVNNCVNDSSYGFDIANIFTHIHAQAFLIRKSISQVNCYFMITANGIIISFTLRNLSLTQENPMHPIASDNISPRIEGKEFPAGK